MTLDNLSWQIVLPILVGFAIGYWVRPFVRTAIGVVCALTVVAFGVFVWEACTHQPTLLEGLGMSQHPDPLQQMIVLGNVVLKLLLETIVTLPQAAYIGFVTGLSLAITRVIKKPKRTVG